MASLSVEVMNRCVPIIVILGGTGTGKSKLGIQIAKRIGGEIISADSMQVYKGLNILTNKVTEEEKDGVVHHLMDFVEPPRNYTVVDFRNEALPIVERLLAQKRCPVLVGGTNYYIESLLWKVLVADTTENGDGNSTYALEQLAFKLGLRPFSDNFKRKVGEEDKTPLDAKGRFVLTGREVSLMCGYPAKVLGLLFDKLGNCQEAACKDLDLRLGSQICVNLANIDYEHCASCQAIKKTAIEVVALKKQTEDMVEKWQSSHPKLHLTSILKDPGNLQFRDLTTAEESLKEVFQQLRQLLAPWVKRLQSDFGRNYCLEIDVDDVPSPDLHNFLSQVDEHHAHHLHPNNKRKIIRSLCVWAESGRKYSEIIEEQRREGGPLGGPLRYKNVIIFWLTCDQEILEKRLDERIDEMFERGLIEELVDFHKKFNPDEDQYTKGIYQSIGFRNFKEYMQLDDEARKSRKGEKMFQKGRESFSIDTKRYVKIQNKWVRNRFLNCGTREVPPVYKLSTSDMGRWTEEVLEPAIEVVLSRMEGGTEAATRLQPVTPGAAAAANSCDERLQLKHELHRCDVCGRFFIGQLQFDAHLKSYKHRRELNKRQRRTRTADT